MKEKWSRLKSQGGTLVFAAICAVVFMLFATIFSIVSYVNNMGQVSQLLEAAEYDQYDYYVAFISSDDSSDFWQQVYAAAKEYGRQQGIYVDMISASLNNEYSQAELLQMAIDMDCDGIMVEGQENEEIEVLLKKATDAGVTIITMQNDCAIDYRTSYVGVSAYSMAQLYADQLSTIMIAEPEPSEPVDVLVLEGPTANESSVGILVTGIQENLASVEGIPSFTVERQYIEDSDAFSTEEFVQDMFQKEQLPDIIICLDELTTTSVYQTMIDYNKVGQLQLLGYYQSDAIFQGISQGVISCTVTVDAQGMGQSAVDAFAEYKDTGYVSDYIMANVSLIDKDNVSEYMQEVDDE